jgi:hypothetical protein
MNSSLILKILIGEFGLMALWAMAEGNWPNLLYAAGAVLLNLGVLLGMTR